MKRIVLLCLFIVGQAHADEWDIAVAVNGKSNHSGDYCNGVLCNEKNDGFGVEARNYARWPTILGAGHFKNSNGFDTWYVGVAKTLRLGDKYGVELGVFGTYMHYPTLRKEYNFFGATPLIVVDFNSVRLNTIYIPAYKDEVQEVWFFQLVIPIRPR